jgi:Bacterial archaeo-eukaryotic release factor family 11
MLYVDVPTLPEVKSLITARSDACMSLYVSTTPQTQHVSASRIAYGNLLKAGLKQLEHAGFDKRRRAALEAACGALREDDAFWTHQSHSLAVLATPDRIHTFRLATTVTDSVEVSDRFQLKPLLRAIAFPQTAFVVALSENAARLIEIFPDLPPLPLKVPGLPKSAGDAVGRASVNNLTQNTRIANAEGQTTLLRQYARHVDAALRGMLGGHTTPLILAATQPLEAIYRNINCCPALLGEGIAGSPDRLSDAELAEAARPVLDKHYKDQIRAAKAQFAARLGDRRATTDLNEIARAATNGAIQLLMVDIDRVMPGTVDVAGRVSLASDDSAQTYDVLDEVAGRAILGGAEFLGVRQADLPEGAPLAAILRYPI